jgi:hypothetical protein
MGLPLLRKQPLAGINFKLEYSKIFSVSAGVPQETRASSYGKAWCAARAAG